MVESYKNSLAKQTDKTAPTEQDSKLESNSNYENKLKNVKHQDVVRLYDIIIQVFNSI